MVEFGQLEGIEIQETVEYVLPLPGDPVLILAHAGESNKVYFNEYLRKSNRTMRAVQTKRLTVDVLAANRRVEIELFPKHIIKDWRGITDKKGKEVPFSAAECREFLEALVAKAAHLFDDIRNFAGDVSNFAGEFDVEEVVKN